MPLNAFPVLNTELYIPNEIDFGLKCMPGNEYKKSITLSNNSFVDFEYRVNFKEPNPNFKICTDNVGILKCGTDTVIEFSFIP